MLSVKEMQFIPKLAFLKKFLDRQKLKQEKEYEQLYRYPRLPTQRGNTIPDENDKMPLEGHFVEKNQISLNQSNHDK